MSLHEYHRIERSLGSVADPVRFLINLFAHAPVGFAVWTAEGHPLLTNKAFLDIFLVEPPPEYNVLKDDLLAKSGMLSLFERAFAGEVVQVPTFWYDPRELTTVRVTEGRRVAISMTIFPLFKQSGELDYVAATYKDETQIMLNNESLRLAEAAIRNSEEDLRTTLDSIGDGVIATDVAGRIVSMNPIAEQLTGWTSTEARGQLLEEVFQIFEEGTRNPVESPVARVLREGTIVGLANHTVLLARDGVKRAIADTAAPIRDAAGAMRGVVLVFHDQTKQRSSERAVERSEAHKAAVLETALDAIVLTDQQGNITDFNPAAERTFGYARSDALGKSIADLLVPPGHRDAHRAGFRRYLETGEGPILGKRIEINALRADGSEFPVELAVVPTRVAGTLSFTGYIRDISERVRAEQALKASEARFRHLADSGIIGIILADTAGNIKDANDAFLSMVGYTRAELLADGLRWADMTPPEWHALDDLALAELGRSGKAKAWEKEYLRKDGSRVPVTVGVASVDAGMGIAFVIDLSERKRAQAVAEQESINRELAEEALKKSEERLRQSQKMEAIGTLAGSIAHDFNNVLSVILGYVESLLGDLRAGDPMRADLEEIGRAGKRAEDLTRQLLAFSRRQILQPKTLDLNLAISDMARMLQRIIGEDIELSFLPAAGLGTVHVDPGQIEQVLLNLVVNARDAMPKGGKLTIETGERDLEPGHVAAEQLGIEPGRYVVLSVSDTGSGMDHATQARIFEPFFSTKGPGKGTGLGLATVHGIVHQSGGYIWVYSELGVGTTFKVYLPRQGAPIAPAEREPPVTSVRGTETILLVEDEDQVRNLIVTILRRHGYQVLSAESGGEAVLICEQHAGPIHLLLTDVVMPRTSGRQLWERVAPTRPNMKVLFMSGYTDDAIVRHGVLSSELDFIQKPLSPSTLLAKVRAVLDAPA